MSEQTAPAAAPAAETAPPAPAGDGIDLDAFSAALNLEPGKPKEASKPAETKPEPPKQTKEPEHLAAANGRKPPKEPLDPLDFDPEALKTPAELNAVKERIIKARKQALDLIRSSHNAIAQAERLKRQHTEKDRTLTERETRVAAWERLVSTAVDDLESGDSERFLTAVGKLSKSGDPVGFWKNAALSLAKGEKLKPAQAAQAAADPELKRRVDALEQHMSGQATAEYNARVEAAKDQNFRIARGAQATYPRLAALAGSDEYASEVREALARVMTAEHAEITKGMSDAEAARTPGIDISRACEILETQLTKQFELSQRADD